MKYALYIFLTCGLVLTGCDTQSNLEDPAKSHFVKFYGRDGEQTGTDVVVLPDGSSVLFGTTTPSTAGSTSQWYLVKVDALGNIIWEYEFGSPNLNETASDIELTSDNKLVAVGNSYTTATDGDILIKTFTLDGAEIASNRRARAGTDENAISVTPISNGFIVTGTTNNTFLKGTLNPVATDVMDALHLRFDNNLVEAGAIWQQTSGFDGIDVAVKTIQISQDVFYVFGYTNVAIPGHPRADYNYWYFALNGFGNISNITFYGPNDDERLSSVAVAPGSYLLSGITYNQSGSADIFISRLRRSVSFNSGDPLFEPKSLSMALGSNVPERTSVYAASAGGFFIVSNERSAIDNQNWLLTKVNDDGSLPWKNPIVFGGEGLDAVGAIKELPDGRLLIIGTMKTGKPDTGESKMTLIKVNAEGKLID